MDRQENQTIKRENDRRSGLSSMTFIFLTVFISLAAGIVSLVIFRHIPSIKEERGEENGVSSSVLTDELTVTPTPAKMAVPIADYVVTTESEPDSEPEPAMAHSPSLLPETTATPSPEKTPTPTSAPSFVPELKPKNTPTPLQTEPEAVPSAPWPTGGRVPKPTAIPKPTAAPELTNIPEPAITQEPVTQIVVTSPDNDWDYEEDTIGIYCGIEVPESEFEYPDSSSRQYTKTEFNNLFFGDARERYYKSQIFIDEIFVRYGYVFSEVARAPAKATYRKYIDKNWYMTAIENCPTQDMDSLMNNYMNSVEQYNIALVNEWQMEVYVEPYD